MSVDEIVKIIDYLDLQTAQVIVRRITDVRRRHKIINQLKRDVKEKVNYFLRFHPKATLSLMHFNYVLLGLTDTIGDAGNAIDIHYKETGKFPEVLIQEKGILVGEVSLATLVRERNTLKLEHFVTEVTTVTYKAEVSEIIHTLAISKRKKIIVLDADASVLGIIYADDAIELFGKLPAESLYNFAGVADSERVFDSVWVKVSHRYKWLIINLGTGFLAASVVSLFENTLNELVLLAIYMPIVAGMGGNAATQTLAVIVRGIAVGEVTLKNSLSPILNEVGAGFINGSINGVLVALVATYWNQNPALGFVLAVAMVVNLVIAGFFGALIPLIMKALGKDPATSATIFITTATDVFGFFVFLGLATVVLM